MKLLWRPQIDVIFFHYVSKITSLQLTSGFELMKTKSKSIKTNNNTGYLMQSNQGKIDYLGQTSTYRIHYC